jgi:DNA-binding NarL/FixJ family response regulator
MPVSKVKTTEVGASENKPLAEKKFLIVDDHAVVRRGLRQILADAFPDATFGEASSAEEAEDKINKEPWSLVILDISMPGRNGLDALKALKPNHPKLPVLVLSVHSEEQYALRTLKAGASGYMTKETAPDLLVEAVNKVLSGRLFVSDNLAERLALSLNPHRPRSLVEQLSDRELEVLKLLASGKTITDIANQLGLSVKTVSTYRTRTLEKLGMRTNSELLRFAIEEGIAG